MKTVVKVFVFAVCVGMMPAAVASQDHESNLLPKGAQIDLDEKPDLVAAHQQEEVSYNEEVSYDTDDFNQEKISKNNLPDDSFDFGNISDDDDDEEDEF